VDKLLPGSGVVHWHAHFAHSPTSVALFASVLSGLPFSFTAHAKDIYTSHPDQLREKLDSAVFVTTCTRHNQHYLEALSERRGTDVSCIYHGIDLSLFCNDLVKVETEPPYQLLTVARVTPKKGLPTIYRALKNLADQGIDFRHVLIGDGDDRQTVLDLLKELALQDRCSWLGSLPHETVLQHFSSSDLFVLGSEIAADGDRDGIPNVLVESLAMGVPAVATNVSAIPEILIDGETGLTVEQKDSEALAKAMVRLLTDSELRSRVIENGKRLVAEQFDNSRLIVNLARLFIKADGRLGKNVVIPSLPSPIQHERIDHERSNPVRPAQTR
jgi:glycosyltransferase involved in cell wall biosynthesis